MKELDFKLIGRKLRKICLSKELTQEYVAEMADVNTSHISNIEHNRVKISLPTLVHVCNALDVTVDYVLSSEYPSPSSSIEQRILLEVQKCDDDMKERILKIVLALQ